MQTMRSTSGDLEKKFSIEGENSLEAMVFEVSMDLTDAELWLMMLEKCFKVIGLF